MHRPDYITEEYRSTIDGAEYVMFRDEYHYDVVQVSDYDADDWSDCAQTAPLSVYEQMLSAMVLAGEHGDWSINTGAHGCVCVDLTSAFDELQEQA